MFSLFNSFICGLCCCQHALLIDLFIYFLILQPFCCFVDPLNSACVCQFSRVSSWCIMLSSPGLHTSDWTAVVMAAISSPRTHSLPSQPLWGFNRPTSSPSSENVPYQYFSTSIVTLGKHVSSWKVNYQRTQSLGIDCLGRCRASLSCVCSTSHTPSIPSLRGAPTESSKSCCGGCFKLNNALGVLYSQEDRYASIPTTLNIAQDS